jgi:hypothetical protein
VFDLAEDEIQHIASESRESLEERALVKEKLGVLEGAMAELKHMKRYYMAAPDLDRNQSDKGEAANSLKHFKGKRSCSPWPPAC